MALTLVALASLPMFAWTLWFDPVRNWQQAVLDDANGPRRWEAVQSAGGMDETLALATFEKGLRSPSVGVRESSIAGLSRLGPTSRAEASRRVIAALDDPHPWIRTVASGALARMLQAGDPECDNAIAALKRRLTDRSPTVQFKAAFALAELGQGAVAMTVLAKALEAEDYAANGEALWVAGRIGPAADELLPAVRRLEARARSVSAPDVVRYLSVYAAFARYRLGERDGARAALSDLANQAEDLDLAGEARKCLARLPEGVRP